MHPLHRIFILIIFLIGSALHGIGQTTFYFEDFESAPCTQNCSVNGFNGWSMVQNGFTGSTPNEWFVSCAENGLPAGQCGSGCVGAGNNSLHVSYTLLQATTYPGTAGVECPTGDCGAVYFFGNGSGASTTNMRAETPAIDLSNAGCDLFLSFSYLENGYLVFDNFSVQYNDGSGWQLLDDPVKTDTCADGKGLWTSYSIALPLTAIQNPNFKLGFLWRNNDDLEGYNPSVAIDSIRITGEVGADASFTFATNPLCGGDDAFATLDTFDSTVSYEWDIDGLIFTGATFPSGISFGAPDTIFVTMTATNAICGAFTYTDSLFIIDCNNPNADFYASSTNICEGDCIDFINTSTGPNVQFEWTFPGGSPSSFSGQYPPQVCYNAAGSYDVTLIVFDGSGISDTAYFPLYITVDDCFAASFYADSTILCDGNCTNFYSTSTGNIIAYQWSFPGASPSTSNSPLPYVCYDVSGPGVYDVTLIVFDTNGNSDTSTQFFYIEVIDCSSPPVVDMSWDTTTVCVGDTVFFTAICPDCVQFDWTFAGGTPSTSSSANPAIIYNTASGTGYTVSLTGTDANGLSSTVTINNLIIVVACDPPVAAFTPSDDSLCTGDCITFTNSSTSGSGALYGWVFQGGTPSTSLFQDPGQVCFNTPGTYTVTLVVVDANGADSVNQTIVVEDCPVPEAFFTASADTICKYDSLIFTNLSANATNYLWSFPGGSPASSTDSIPPAVIYSGTSGNYTVTLYVSDDNGQDSTFTWTFYLSGCGRPDAEFTVSDDVICEGDCIEFFDMSLDVPTGWLWSFPGAIPDYSTQQNPPYICYPNAGVYDVQLVAFNNYGPDTQYAAGYITVNPPPQAGINIDSVGIIQGQTIQLTAGGGVSYAWYPNLDITSDSTASTIVMPMTSTTYTVIVTDVNGCTAQAEAIVNVRPPDFVFVPNLFTPNDDRINDVLKLNYTGAIERCEFAVFDRWGNSVFYTNDETEGWDGTYHGKPLNVGVYAYFYRIRFVDGYVARGKGDVTLIR